MIISSKTGSPSRRRSILALALLALPAPRPASATPLESAARAFAREEFTEVLKHLPGAQTEAEANLLRARALLQLGRHAAAEKLLGDLVSALPELRDLVLFLRAEALLGAGRHADAAGAYRAAARSRDSRFIYVSWRRRADALLAAKQWSAAAEELRHLVRTQADHAQRADWELALALCMEKLGQPSKAMEALRELWLTRPITSAATRARKELERIASERKLSLRPPPIARRLARIRLLRKEKLYEQTLAELKELRRDLREKEGARVDLETALTLIWANRPGDALPVLQKLPSGVLAGWHLRALIASCMARTGKVEEAAKLLLKQSWREKGPLRTHERAEIGRAATILADHGRYAEALRLRLRLAALDRKLGPEAQHQLGWLSLRAGRFTEALKHLQSFAKKAKGEKDYSMYWLARAHGGAGETDKAIALYRELLEKHGHSYYGLLARTRLVEAGKLKLAPAKPGQCGLPPASAPSVRYADVLGRLTALQPRYREFLPELPRATTLWRLGMLADARRELRLLAIRVAWIAAKGRPREWIQRPSVERLWRGGPLETRRFGKGERKLAAEGAALRHSFGALLQSAGISYFGWQLGAPDPNPERRRNPRAYPELVAGVGSQFKLDPNLIWAIMRTESTYRLDVISRVGATGLMQIMPHTGRRIAAAMKLKGYEHDHLFEPETNLQMAGWYLRALFDKFKGQIPLIAAGYNGGPHHVARWLEMRGKRCQMDEFIEEIPFSESRRYAKKILRLTRLYERVYCGKDDRMAVNRLDAAFAPQPDF